MYTIVTLICGQELSYKICNDENAHDVANYYLLYSEL